MYVDNIIKLSFTQLTGDMDDVPDLCERIEAYIKCLNTRRMTVFLDNIKDTAKQCGGYTIEIEIKEDK